ncbi:MAG TPA: hypothetical protein VM869_35130, partial [Enhygromyxa sp.]|nr:hypothetical protein [Enhygromyxa sp.]
PEHVLGRDELIARYWNKLETQSIALLAPRRIGKTSITKRMIAFPPARFIVRARDLEDVDSVVQFARALFEDVEAQLRSFTRVAARGRAVLASLGIVEIKDFRIELGELSWRKLLDQVFADLDEHAQAEGRLVVLVWDEFTYFISELALNGHERDAMALLDSLRAARQKYQHVRMVLTGSIGLPEMERRLRNAGHRNRALNDVAVEIVPLFDETNARLVTAALLRGAALDVSAEVVDAIIELSEGHPMIIQLLVEGLKAHARVDVRAVEAEFSRAVEPPGDPLDLRYYTERIEQNFGSKDAELACAILDALALQPGQTLNELLERLPGPTTRTLLSDLLRHLIDDFYIVRSEGKHEFRLRLLREFWLRERGL